MTSEVRLSVSAGTLTSNGGFPGLTASLDDGSYTWNNLQINALGDNVTITVTDMSTSFTPVVSRMFNVVSNRTSTITRAPSGGETPSIAYGGFQAASNLTEGGSVRLFTFRISDEATIGEKLKTKLTDISFDITNHRNLRTLALFNSSSPLVELDVGTNISDNTLTFSLTSESAIFQGQTFHGSSGNMDVRATFLESVVDGEQIGLTVSNVVADASGSVFATPNGAPSGGSAATTDLSSDNNAIVVDATKLTIAAPSTAVTDTNFEITVTAVDDLGNTDLDANTDVTLSLTSGTGLSSVGGSLTATLSRGTFTWSDLRYNAAGDIMIAAASGALTDADPESITVGATAVAVTATAFSIVAPATVEVGTPFEIAVKAVDDDGATDVSPRDVTLSHSGSGILTPASALTTVAMTSGAQTWSGLAYNTVGSLTVTVTDNTGSLSPFMQDIEFTAAPVVATTFAIVEPTDPVVENTDFSLTVRAVDGSGATATTGTIQVRLRLSSGGGNLTSDGTAAGLTVTLDETYTHTWNDLRYDTDETIRIGATHGNPVGGFGIATATSTDIVVGPAPVAVITATTFAIEVPTTSVTENTNFSVTVTAVDNDGATDVSETSMVTLSRATGTGTLISAGGTSLSRELASGTYTWDDLQFDTPEDITLTVTDSDASGLTAATSSSITITAASAVITATTFAIEVSDNVAKDTDFSLTVTAVDASGTPATDAAALTTAVTLSLASGATGALSPSGMGLTATLDAGTYTWENLQYDVAESIMITVADGTLTEATSDPINVFELLNTVFFSEYIEGGSRNKALEIYNGSGGEVDLTEFTIDKYVNGSPNATTYSLTEASFAAGDVYVVAHNHAVDVHMDVVKQADVRDGFFDFNGNDGIALLHNGVIVDIIGDNAGNDPGRGWSVAGMDNETQNSTLVRKQSVNVGNAKAAKTTADESSFGTTLDNSEWIVYPEDEFRYLGSHCTQPSTQASNVTFGTTDGTSMVVNWVKGDGDNSLVVVKAASEVDATPTWNNDYTGATAVFSDAVATLTTDNVVVYSGELATVTVTGLTPGETYHVAVYAYNADRFCYNTVSPAIASKATIVSDTDSDITRAVGGGETDNIDYSTYQATSDLTEGGSVSLFTFNIDDKGTADGLPTIVTAISFDITNHENLRVLALFDGTMRLAELEITSNTVAFTGLDIQALDNGNKDVNVRATFLESVDDGEQIGLTITSVTAAATGSSTFAADNGGGATTDITTSTASNAIVVTAVKLVLTEVPTATLKNVAFEVVVTAADDNNNTDVADRMVTLSQTKGTGLTSSGFGPVAMSSGT